jgi:hypothetical protein
MGVKNAIQDKIEIAMSERIRDILASLRFYGSWALIAALLVVTLYQVHSTLAFVGLQMVKNPATRPAGWNTGTIYGLSRFLFLVLGAVWLVIVMLLEPYLRAAVQAHQLWQRVVRLVLATAAILGVNYVVLLLLS